MDVVTLRQRVGMVFQRWNPFPKSIYDNVAYGPRINAQPERADLDEHRRVGAAARRAVGRSEGPAARQRARALRRTAAAAVHRARARERSGGAAARRAGIGARPDRDAEDRGAALRAEARADHRHRDAQPAAGRARLGPHGVLLPRTARRDGRHRSGSSRARARSAPRRTSRGDSDEPRRSPVSPLSRPARRRSSERLLDMSEQAPSRSSISRSTRCSARTGTRPKP